MAELPSLGRQCGWPTCKQLDFLPLECHHCSITFCKEHHPFSSHACPSRPDRVLDASECRTAEGYACSWQGCQRRELVAVLCSQCGVQVCLDHRLAIQHGCPSLKEQADAALKCAQKEEAFVRDANIAKQEVDAHVAQQLKRAKNRARAAQVQLMKLKSRASLANRGTQIAQTERVHLLVQASGGSGGGEVLVVSREWTLGRAVDTAANLCALKNSNNVPGALRLRFTHDDASAIDENRLDAKISALIAAGQLCDGQTLLLKYFE